MEPILMQSWTLLYPLLYIFMITYLFQTTRLYTYVKGLFLTYFFLNIISWIFERLMYTFSIAAINNVFGYNEPLYLIPVFLNVTPHVLMLVGLSLMIGKDDVSRTERVEYPIMKGQRRHIGISLLLFVVTLGIYFPFWLYRTVKDLRNNFPDDIPYTPGKAVGFSFIPIVGIFWGFYILFSLPSRIKRIESKYYGKSVGFFFHPIMIPILLILFAITSSFQIQLAFETHMWGLVLFFHAASIVLWLTMQAKLNALFDYAKGPAVNPQ